MTQDEILMQLQPEFANRIRKVIQNVAKRGHNIKIAQGLRTIAYQNSLYAQGRTKKGSIVTNAKGGFSPHNYGCAVDFCLVEGVPEKQQGKMVITQFPNSHPVWAIIGEEGKKLGLEWGGDWKSIKDRPHLEVPILKYGSPLLKLVGKDGNLAKVFQEAQRVFLGQTGVSEKDVLNPDNSETWNYTVKAGDNLSIIAKKHLGDAKRYLEIKQLNKLTSDSISIGQVLIMPKR